MSEITKAAGDLSLQAFSTYDKSGMLERVLRFSEQLRHAQEIAQGTEVRLERSRIRNVCICGMGGSAIGGDLVRSFSADQLSVPVVVNRDYTVPNFVDEGTLAVVSSYSGNTEETLSAYEQVCQRRAQVVCITSGGTLGEQAGRNGHPVFVIPGGFPPRSALGYLTVPLLYALHYAGLLVDPSPQVAEAVSLLAELNEEYGPDAEANLAKELSLHLHGSVPLIYAAAARVDAVALRWKGQLAENAEMLAFCNSFPELTHNEIMGWGPNREVNQRFRVVYLKDRQDHPQVVKRMALAREVFEPQAGSVFEVRSRGESLFARIFSLIFLGDMVSLYLAVLNGVDPTPVKHIESMKRRLLQS
ncbi:MAG: bifunctional phosphoglucose/phosphomannose isomerase [Calditrichaeota bacterium]|nr:MAG: bifunctional phosphoglucose/phosphomannose isomerase [Calditrichota bacterium]